MKNNRKKYSATDLKEYFYYYNNERIHQAFGYKTPAEIYLK